MYSVNTWNTEFILLFISVLFICTTVYLLLLTQLIKGVDRLRRKLKMVEYSNSEGSLSSMRLEGNEGRQSLESGAAVLEEQEWLQEVVLFVRGIQSTWRNPERWNHHNKYPDLTRLTLQPPPIHSHFLKPIKKQKEASWRRLWVQRVVWRGKEKYLFKFLGI